MFRLSSGKRDCRVVRESKKPEAKPEMGSPEQFYAEVIRQPSLAIEIPEYRKDDMEELRLIPLEYLYSLNSGILANA